MSKSEHIHKDFQHINCKVITISDTRTEDNDKSGKLMKDLLRSKSHRIVDYVIVKDDKQSIQNEVKLAVMSTSVQAILLNGGTGISSRDITPEALQPLFTKEIEGFGELFRLLSYTEDIGSAAMLSRATAGIIDHTLVFSTPGSTGAVRLAMEKLILPELSHMVSELHKK